MKLEDEVLAKMFGYTGSNVEEFNRELFNQANVQIAHNAIPDYKPSTSKLERIAQLIKNMAPFIKETLDKDILVTKMDGKNLDDYIKHGSVMYFPEYKNKPAVFAVCASAVFRDDLRAYEYELIRKGFKACNNWLIPDYGIFISDFLEPLLGGFPEMEGFHPRSPAARFYKVSDANRAERSLRRVEK